jgi:hypothetical protein
LRVTPPYQAEPNLVDDDLAVQQPRPGLGNFHGLRQEVVQLDHFDPAGAHLVHKVEMIGLGPFHPRELVEQQVVLVRRREPEMRQSRGAHQHLAKVPYL